MASPTVSAHDIDDLINAGELAQTSEYLASLPHHDVAAILDRLPREHSGIAFRLLPKDVAVDVFDDLSPRSHVT